MLRSGHDAAGTAGRRHGVRAHQNLASRGLSPSRLNPLRVVVEAKYGRARGTSKRRRRICTHMPRLGANERADIRNSLLVGAEGQIDEATAVCGTVEILTAPTEFISIQTWTHALYQKEPEYEIQPRIHGLERISVPIAGPNLGSICTPEPNRISDNK